MHPEFLRMRSQSRLHAPREVWPCARARVEKTGRIASPRSRSAESVTPRTEQLSFSELVAASVPKRYRHRFVMIPEMNEVLASVPESRNMFDPDTIGPLLTGMQRHGYWSNRVQFDFLFRGVPFEENGALSVFLRRVKSPVVGPEP